MLNLSGCGGSTDPRRDEVRAAEAQMSETIQLRVTGMTCGGCENAVRRSVGQLAGVERVTASHEQERVDVVFDPAKVTRQAIEQKIETIGYHVEP
jgi:copper chaperone